MESESFSTNALFASAILAGSKHADYLIRSSIITSLPIFSIDSLGEARTALKERLNFGGLGIRNIKDETMVNAALAARFWAGMNIGVIISDCFSAVGDWNLPEVFFYRGDTSILAASKAGILNSRKHGITCAEDQWLKTTRQLVSTARAKHVTVTSYGSIHHNVVALLCRGHRTICVCPGPLPWMSADEMKAFAPLKNLFAPLKTLFLSPFAPGILPCSKERMKIRDKVIAAVSDILFVSEVRPNGNMAEIAEKARSKVKEYSEPCFPPISNPTTNTGICVVDTENAGGKAGLDEYDGDNTTPKTASDRKSPASFSRLEKREVFLTHYTRSCRGPWPGQSMEKYCRSLVTNARGAGHTAFDALSRILDEKTIRASGRLYRGRIASVSFTECTPEEISKISKWRKGLIRWSFEPYGLRIPIDLCRKAGAKPVIYGPSFVFDDLGNDLQFLFQRYSNQGPNWFEEREWRIQGDMILSPEILEAAVVLVSRHEEAELIADEFGLEVCLFKDEKQIPT